MSTLQRWHNIPLDDDSSPVVRTYFGNEEQWESLRRAVGSRGEFIAPVHFVDDRAFDGLTPAALVSIAEQNPDGPTFLILADQAAMASDEYPLLVVDLFDQPGRFFRVIASELWGVASNLPIANMDWEDFADSVDADGVFRRFPR
jgi:hypothetical protein